MAALLGILLVSWISTIVLFIPFIRLLYSWKLQRLKQKTRDAFDQRTPIFDKFHGDKAGTPVGGGLLIILLTSIFFPIILLLIRYFWLPITSAYPMVIEIFVLLFTFICFGLLGLVDDVKKTFFFEKSTFFGLRLRHKLILEILLAVIVSFILMYQLKIQIINIPLFGVVDLGWWYIPFASFVIIAFSNAYNITDGLDGLAAGVLMIALVAFWVLSASILDTVLSVFIALWLGGILAFLYFNIHPARLFLGDVGALSFGATFAVVGLILGKGMALPVIGGIFVLEVSSSLVQMISRKILGRKIFACAPLHLWLQYRGWGEAKIVARFWILSIIFAIFGLWLAVLTNASL